MGGERMYFVGGIMSIITKNPPGSRRVMRSLY